MIEGTLFSILQRAGAVLTGARTSVVGGRAVIFDTGRHCAPSIQARGVKLGTFTCSAMSFVDNFYTYGRTALDALTSMQTLEVSLFSRWGLRFGAKSKLTNLK